MHARHYSKVLYAFMLICMCGYAVAQEAAKTSPQYSAEWVACKQSEECTIVGAECGNPSAVNIHYAKEYGRIIRGYCTKNAPADLIAQAKKAVAYCVLKACTAYMPNSLLDPTLYLCKEDSECGRTVNMCGVPQAVNLQKMAEYDEVNAQIKNKGGPACASIPPELYEKLNSAHEKCLNNRCTLTP